MKTTQYRLKDLITIKNGADYKHLKYGEIPVYGSGGITAYVNESIFDGESILLPRKGSLNNIIYVNKKFWTIDTMYFTIINHDICDVKYLYYYLSLLDLSHRDSGSTLPSMTFNSYYDLIINLPDISLQRKISRYLSNIENKIKINNHINDNLQ